MRVMWPIWVIGHAHDSRRYCSILGRGEQEFVVFAAVQGEFEIYLVRRLAHAGPRNGFRFHFGAHAAFFANVGQVGGKAVAGVDHGGGQAFLAKHAAQFNSRLRKKMPRILGWVQLALGLLRRSLRPDPCCSAAAEPPSSPLT